MHLRPFIMIETNHRDLYWNGTRNKAIRYFYYSQRGLDLFNQFRYLLMAIFGVYLLLKLSNPLWLLAMFAISFPLLVLAGYYQVHHMSKVIDWLNTEFATYWSRYSFSLSERSVKALESIDRKTFDFEACKNRVYPFEGGILESSDV